MHVQKCFITKKFFTTWGSSPNSQVWGAGWVRSKVKKNAIAYQQGTSKREGAQSVNLSVSRKVIPKPPTPVQTPKQISHKPKG